MKHYKRFQVGDFVADPDFRRWVLSADKYRNRFWQQWMVQHPEQRKMIDQAKSLVKMTDFSPAQCDENTFQIIKENIKDKLFRKPVKDVFPSKRNGLYLLSIVIAICAFLIELFFLLNKRSEID